MRRLRENKTPEKRFHYRYVACNHAWDAAALMPDESDATARVLAEAGGWIKYRDPMGALRFYKALITRCGTTAIGKDAAARHWFKPESPKPNSNNDAPQDNGYTPPANTPPPV